MKPSFENDKPEEHPAPGTVSNASTDSTLVWDSNENNNNLVPHHRYSTTLNMSTNVDLNKTHAGTACCCCSCEHSKCTAGCMNTQAYSPGFTNIALDMTNDEHLDAALADGDFGIDDKHSPDDDFDDRGITWTDFDIRSHRFNARKLARKVGRNCAKSAKHFSLKEQLFTMFPLFDKMRNYNVKQDLALDFIAGITVSILHIPQGIAYSFLIGIPPVYGLYTSFFPVLIYAILGTSSHISVGTMSVLDMMLSQTVKKYHSMNIDQYNSSITLQKNAELYSYELDCTAIQLLVVLCILVGLYQIFMGIFQMGAISIILSDQLVSGFSCGAAVHVVVSQIPSVLEIKAHKIKNIPFAVFYSLVDIAKHLYLTKMPALILSSIVFFVLIFYKEILDKRVKKRMSLPVPIDLIVIVVCTAVSYAWELNKVYNITIMGAIPTGIPPPELPVMRLTTRKDVLLDALVLALVSYASALSLAKMYAKKHNYTVRANQEFFALGLSNFGSSFFSCFPATASLSRASVMGTLARTQISSVISCTILLLVLLFLAPVLTTLPKCVVAVIIICAQKSLLMQCLEFTKAWKISRYEGFIWLVTFLAVVCFGIDIGLITGAIFSVFTIVLRFYHPKSRLLGQLPYTEIYYRKIILQIYLDIHQHRAVKEIPGVKIIQFTSPLFFMNKDMFQESVLKRTLKNQTFKGCSEGFDYGPVNTLVLDCSSMCFIDTNGVEAIAEISNELQRENIQVCLAALAPPVISMLTRIKFFEQSPYTLIFPSVHDAVLKSDTPLLSRKMGNNIERGPNK